MPGFSAPTFMAVDNAVGNDLTPAEKQGVVDASNGQMVGAITNARATAAYKNTAQLVTNLQKSSVHDQESWWRTASPTQQGLVTSQGYKKPIPMTSGMLALSGSGGIGVGGLLSNLEGIGGAVKQLGEDVAGGVKALGSAVASETHPIPKGFGDRKSTRLNSSH